MADDEKSADPGDASVMKQEPDPRTAGWRRMCGLLLTAGILTGLAGWQCAERLNNTFQLPLELADASPLAGGETGRKVEAANRDTTRKNRMLVLGMLGGFGGLFFGVAAGLTSSSVRLVLGLTIGVLLGGGCGVVSAFTGELAGAAFDTLPHQQESQQDLNQWASYRAIPVHVATLAMLGLGWGIAAGVAFGRHVVAAVLAAVGATAVWGALFPFLGAILFPQGSPDSAIPAQTNLQIFWAVGTGVITAVALYRAGKLSPASDAPESSDVPSE